MKQFGSETGFTLPELIMVILIVSILASIAVPKFVQLTGEEMDKRRCAQARSSVNSVAYIMYSKVLIDDPTKFDWMQTFTFAEIHDTMFATGSIPVCPVGGTLSISGGVCECDLHGK